MFARCCVSRRQKYLWRRWPLMCRKKRDKIQGNAQKSSRLILFLYRNKIEEKKKRPFLDESIWKSSSSQLGEHFSSSSLVDDQSISSRVAVQSITEYRKKKSRVDTENIDGHSYHNSSNNNNNKNNNRSR